MAESRELQPKEYMVQQATASGDPSREIRWKGYGYSSRYDTFGDVLVSDGWTLTSALP